jgi:riboflavin kinase / FMN adenylyltransferase
MSSNDEKRKSPIPPTLFVGKPKSEPMARVYSAEEWVERFHSSRGKHKTTVVTIGNFDGVHLGHQAILRAARESAGQLDGMSVALTFFPHPAKLLRPGDAPQLLMTLDQRLAAIEQLEIDATLVLRFDDQLAQLSAEEFVTKYLKRTLKTQSVVYGENFRFGHKGVGDASTLYDMGIDLYPCAPVKVGDVVVSSTAIRTAIREGRVDAARRMLARPYALAGEIRTGTGQGRKLVVPTLNLATEQELLPKNGVYATEAVVAGKTYRAATNVGMRPTFDGARITIESHLFDFSDNLTSGELEVKLWQRLRDERKFSGPAELREQILKDIEQAKEFFKESKTKEG